MNRPSKRTGGVFVRHRRVLLSKVLPITLIVLCIYNTLQQDELNRQLQGKSDGKSQGKSPPKKHGPGKYNGRYKYCRTPYVLMDNVMATMPPLTPPEDRINPPSFVQLCEAFIDRSKLNSTELEGLPEVRVVEDPAICLDWSAPHYTTMSIFASSLVAAKGLDLGLRYNHNCHNFMLQSRDDRSIKYDYTTAQQVLTENLISARDADDVDDDLVKSLCHGCISHHEQHQPSPLAGMTHHCFLFPGGQAATHLKENRKEIPLTSVLRSFVDRMRHMTEDWIDTTDALDFEDESGVIVALDERSTFMDMGFYDKVITERPTSVQIFASASCAIASVQRRSDCIEHGRSLKAYFKLRFPESTYVRYDIVASTATSFARMMSASKLICPPNTITCLLPALGKLAGKKAYVAEDGSKPGTFHWFEGLIDKRKSLGLQMPGYDPVADEDFLIISEETSQEIVPEDLPKEDLDHEPHYPHLPPDDGDVDGVEDHGTDYVTYRPHLPPVDGDVDGYVGGNEDIDGIHPPSVDGDGDQDTDYPYSPHLPPVEGDVDGYVDVDRDEPQDPFPFLPPLDIDQFQNATVGIDAPLDTDGDEKKKDKKKDIVINTEQFETDPDDQDGDVPFIPVIPPEFNQTEPVEGTRGDVIDEYVPVAPIIPQDINLTETAVEISDKDTISSQVIEVEQNDNSSMPLLGSDIPVSESDLPPPDQVKLMSIYDYWNDDYKDHTFHFGDPWEGEVRGIVQFYAYPVEVQGSLPVYSFVNEATMDHTFHFGDPWPGETQLKIEFYAFPGPVDGLNLQPVYSYWHESDISHTFHMGDPWDGEVVEDRIVFYAFPPM